MEISIHITILSFVYYKCLMTEGQIILIIVSALFTSILCVAANISLTVHINHDDDAGD